MKVVIINTPDPDLCFIWHIFSYKQEISKRLYTRPTSPHLVGERALCIKCGGYGLTQAYWETLHHPKWISDAVSLLKSLNSVCWSQEHISKLTEDDKIARWQMKYAYRRVSLHAGTPGGKSRTSRRLWQLDLYGICLWTYSVISLTPCPTCLCCGILTHPWYTPNGVTGSNSIWYPYVSYSINIHEIML